MTNQIQFSKPGEWVMRITADRRIEVNEDVTVTEAAQTVLEAVQKLLEQQAEPVHGDIRALKYRIHELEGEVIGYKRMLDVAEAPPQRKPLTIAEVEQILAQHNYEIHGDRARYIVRMTEEAHDIGEKP